MPHPAAQRELWQKPRRYKVRFPDDPSYAAASALELNDLPMAVSSAKRRFFTLSIPNAYAGLSALEKRLDQRLDFLSRYYEAEVTEDYRWDLDLPPIPVPEQPAEYGPSLDDVVEAIGAPAAWAEGNRGQGATIAVVDTGISGNRREIGKDRRRGSWQPDKQRPWTDPVGHGTMCAVIAAGSRADGGRFDGVAPEAGVIACRTRFFDSELASIYDWLTVHVKQNPGMRLIATNSFGRRYGALPPEAITDFPAALGDAITAGVAVLFSAGNNHELAGGLPQDCHPCTIWDHKLRPDVLTVGACDLEGEMWHYSSRGPAGGIEAGRPKPDVVAPVPRNGLVAFGDADRRFPDGWGTSGACPQAAGLAALIWTGEPGLKGEEVFERIQQKALDFGRAVACQGKGRVAC